MLATVTQVAQIATARKVPPHNVTTWRSFCAYNDKTRHRGSIRSPVHKIKNYTPILWYFRFTIGFYGNHYLICHSNVKTWKGNAFNENSNDINFMPFSTSVHKLWLIECLRKWSRKLKNAKCGSTSYHAYGLQLNGTKNFQPQLQSQTVIFSPQRAKLVNVT